MALSSEGLWLIFGVSCRLARQLLFLGVEGGVPHISGDKLADCWLLTLDWETAPPVSYPPESWLRCTLMVVADVHKDKWKALEGAQERHYFWLILVAKVSHTDKSRIGVGGHGKVTNEDMWTRSCKDWGLLCMPPQHASGTDGRQCCYLFLVTAISLVLSKMLDIW